MNIKGVGVDIIEIERLRNVVSRQGRSFIDKVFTKNEQKYANKFKDPLPRLAARFAAKEALVKALGIGFGKKISFLDIEIKNEKTGQPIATLSKKAKKNFVIEKILLSISHSNLQAVAMCVVY